MPYTHTSWSTLRTYLSEYLNDTGKVFWVDDELKAHLTEALRTWGALTAYWRERGTFVTANATPFYLLRTQLSSLLGAAATDHDIIKVIQYNLLESAVSQSSWAGTEMFTLPDVRDALAHARDDFLVSSGVVLTRSASINMPPPSVSRVSLPDTIMDVRRVVWQSADGSYSHLWREDDWKINSLLTTIQQSTPGTPIAYSIAATRPVEIQVFPPPSVNATLDVISVSSGAALDPANSATVLGVPDGLTWIPKWRALASLLSDTGQSADQTRRGIAQRLYELGLEAVQLYPIVFQVQIQGVATILDTLHSLDAFHANWQGDVAAQPTRLALTGDILAAYPTPDGIYSVTLDMVRNAPIPALDADFVQIGREELDAIITYAGFLAVFKEGGAEAVHALENAQSFFRAAIRYGERMGASVSNARTLLSLSGREEQERPRMVSEEVTT